MPQGAFIAFDAEGFGRSDPQDWKRSIHYTDIRSASIFQGGLAMYVERFKVSDTAKGLAFLMPQRHEGEVKGYKFGDFEIRQVSYNKPGNYVVLFFANGSEIYTVGTCSRDPNNPMLSRFLGSIRLNGKPIFNTQGDSSPVATSSASFEELSESFVQIVEDLTRERDDKNNSEPPVQQPPPPKDNTGKPLVIIMKPLAAYTDAARKAHEVGNIRLRISFLPDASIEKITVLNKLKHGLLENAVKAAKRIKMLPPEKDGVPQPRELTVEYGFNIY
jgi:TonB family protein